jgi:hypothetical protein
MQRWKVVRRASPNRWLRVEFEAVEFTHEGELGDFAGHGDESLVAPRNLTPDNC